MNNALYIVFIPLLLVVAGYTVMLRYAGLAPGYLRLAVAVTVFFGAIYWLTRKSRQKSQAK
ncbi:MAG TPA: hypothetical protein VE545_04035 [Candidatus Dormibacteraeota bacterium]|nr:hypothetical protein [Candidatus Dormibacteraeota bacterium]